MNKNKNKFALFSRNSRKNNKIKLENTKNSEVDFNFYREYYSDLSEMTDKQLTSHWETHGKLEGRICSILVLNEILGIVNQSELDMNLVDSDFYKALYPDLQDDKASQLKVTVHYYQYGKTEARIPSYNAWLESKEIDVKTFTDKKILAAVTKAISSPDKGQLQLLLDVISTEKIHIIPLGKTEQKTAGIYKEIAKKWILSGNKPKGMQLLRAALVFVQDADIYESLGNYYLDESHPKVAINYYGQALSLNPKLFWSSYNKVQANLKLENNSEALECLMTALDNQADKTQYIDFINKVSTRYWQEKQAYSNLLVDIGNREDLIELNITTTQLMNDVYMKVAGKMANVSLGNINTDRILIVADYHVSQCVRYRIDQKIEQLELAGKDVKAIDWTKLSESKAELATHDIIIFYRVPATPEVIQAIAQTNAVGKLSIYEIDDLLFDSMYRGCKINCVNTYCL